MAGLALQSDMPIGIGNKGPPAQAVPGLAMRLWQAMQGQQQPSDSPQTSPNLWINDPAVVAQKIQELSGVVGGPGAGMTKAWGKFAGEAIPMAERMAQQGGALASKPGLRRITQALDDHGIEWSEHPNGGVTAYADVVDKFGRAFKEGKHFAENTSLKTLRDWLGY